MRWYVVSGLAMFLAGSAPSTAELPRNLKPILVWTGTDTKQPIEQFTRCCSQKDWKAVWNAHGGRAKDTDDLAPEVDFDSYMIIAVFHESSRLRIGDIREENGCIRIRYHPYGNQIVFVPDPNARTVKIIEAGRGEIDPEKPRTLSFAFVLLPRSKEAIVIEEDVQSLIGKPAIWKERARLPAIGKK
jgi:hypothetical protein